MMTTNDSLRSLQWDGEALTLLDQTKLPGERVYIRCIDWRVVAEAIKMLRVRGAPAQQLADALVLVLLEAEFGPGHRLIGRCRGIGNRVIGLVKVRLGSHRYS